MKFKKFIWSIFCLLMALIIVPILWAIFYHHPISGKELGLEGLRMSIMTSPIYLPIIFTTLSMVIFKNRRFLAFFIGAISFILIGLLMLNTEPPSWAFWFTSEVYLAYFIIMFLTYLPLKKS